VAKPVFLFTGFEAASPLLWDVTAESVEIQALHDHERGSSNRQASHWYFEIRGEAGQRVRMRMLPLENIYGGHRAHFLREGLTSVYSVDGKVWSPVTFAHHPDRSLSLEFTLPAAITRFSLVQPYTTADLSGFLDRLKKSPHASFTEIARTAEGRPVELVTLSAGKAKKSVLLRARAHPWETGGSFFLEGVVQRLLDTPTGGAILERLDFHLIPMANKDGVVRGMSRFNPLGADLNRNFRPGFDHAAQGAPENAGLLAWLTAAGKAGRLPSFALDLHNDQEGNLHLSPDDGKGYRERMLRFDALLREYTPYREGAKDGAASGTFGDGLLSMFGIDAAILELNAQWLEGKQAVPLAGHWREYGSGFVDAVAKFLGA